MGLLVLKEPESSLTPAGCFIQNAHTHAHTHTQACAQTHSHTHTPTHTLQHILGMLVMPRLRTAVTQWEPRQETVPIHAWLHPWLPFLGPALEELYPVIRHKLGVALQVCVRACVCMCVCLHILS